MHSIAIFIAAITITYTDATVSIQQVKFYTLKDCNTYLSENHQTKNNKEMVLDEDLIWTYKTIASITKSCSYTTIEKK